MWGILGLENPHPHPHTYTHTHTHTPSFSYRKVSHSHRWWGTLWKYCHYDTKEWGNKQAEKSQHSLSVKRAQLRLNAVCCCWFFSSNARCVTGIRGRPRVSDTVVLVFLYLRWRDAIGGLTAPPVASFRRRGSPVPLLAAGTSHPCLLLPKSDRKQGKRGERILSCRRAPEAARWSPDADKVVQNKY